MNLIQSIPKLDDKNHPILDDYKFGIDYSKIWMTRTIQCWMDINLLQIIPKVDDKNHPTLDDYKLGTDNHPILEPYCIFSSLYRKMSYFHPKLEGYITE